LSVAAAPRRADNVHDGQASPDVAAFIGGLIDNAARQRLPELFTAEYPNAVYRVSDRNGVGVLVLRTPDLSEEHLVALMKFRLAQYLAVNFVDTQMIYEARMEYEPLSGVSRHDVHYIAGSPQTGEILCYAAVKAGPDAQNATLRDRDRPLFPVEKVHGWGIYNRLRVLPDVQVNKLREMGRFVKNQRLHTFDELGARAPIEIGVALFRTLVGPLRLEVDAIIGDLEEGVAKQNLDFFHVPLVVLHGTVPYEAEASYFYPRYQFCVVYPFAILSSDISAASLGRLDAVERALEIPGKQGLVSLIALKRDILYPKSSLEPAEGLAPLTDAKLAQQGVPMPVRLQMLEAGERLRTSDLFRNLSVAEATILGTFMERREYVAGDVCVRQGDIGDELFLIESGHAEVWATSAGGEAVQVATLGPGDFFGEIALVTGAERGADVIAATPLVASCLSRDAYTRYLARAAEVEQEVTRAAVSRMRSTAQLLPRGVRHREADVVDLFSQLSAADASVMGTFMESVDVGAGTVIVRRAESGDALYVIVSGEAEVRVARPAGGSVAVATLGPGEYFGEISLVTGGERIADVVALTPMSLVRLSSQGYAHFIAHSSAMQQQIATTAATRASATARSMLASG
jgi:CRP-like cAMP-binding protein